MDSIACNYDLAANTDDGSCYNNDVGCGCDELAALENADCNGDCLEGYFELGNGCELLVEGCTDETACNYDDTANIDDGSCVYPVDSCTDCDGDNLGGQDCNGVCEGVASEDECGICDNDPSNDNDNFIDDYFALDSPCYAIPSGSIITVINSIYSFDELSFQWYIDGNLIDGENSQNIFNIGAGNYVLEVSNGLCALLTEDIYIQEAEPVVFTQLDPFDYDGYEVDCGGNSEMTIGFSGGDGPYDLSVVFNDAITTTYITNITSPYTITSEYLFGEGDYEFIIYSAQGLCLSSSNVVPFFQDPDGLEVSFENTNDCFDSASVPEGVLSLVVSGGTPPYVASYSPCLSDCFGATTADDQVMSFNGLLEGSYEVNIIDDTGCEFTSTQFIDTNDEIVLTILEQQSSNCCMADVDGDGICDIFEETAFFTIQVTGGTPPYTYEGVDINANPISGESSQVTDVSGALINVITLDDLATGIYIITIEDDGGCAASTSTFNNIVFESFPGNDTQLIFTVDQIEPMNISITDFSPVECFGDESSISFSVSQTGSTSNSFSVEVFENTETIFTDELEVGSLELDFCFPSLNNGTSQSIITTEFGVGGVLPPLYLENVQDGDVFGFFNKVNPALNPNGYQCVGGLNYTDTEFCDDFIGQSGISISGEISMPWSLGNMFDPASNTLSFITWFEDSTDPNLGILTGSNVNWSSNEVFGFIQRDGEIYECVIEFWVGEFSGQQFFDTYAGLSTSMYIESIIVANEPFIGGDGTVSVTFNPEYGDEYDFVFTDEYGCTQLIELPSEDFQFPVPEEELIFSVIADNTSCPNGSNGSLNVSVSGGYGIYEVSIYDDSGFLVESVSGSAENTITIFENLPANEYSIEVVDELGCVEPSGGLWLVAIEDPEEITIINEEILPVSCNTLNTGNSSDGFIELVIEGGTPPYNIDLNQGAELLSLTLDESTPFTYTYFISDLNPGLYFLNIQDDNGCYSELNGVYQIEVLEPELLEVTSVVSEYGSYGISCYGESDGSIDLTVAGGTGDYTYEWIGTNTDTQDVGGLEAGTYSVVVTDENQCSELLEFDITQPDVIDLIGDVSDYVTNYNGYEVSCSGENDGQIGIITPLEIIGGVGNYVYTWFEDSSLSPPLNGIYWNDMPSLDGVFSGTYVLQLQDENECLFELTFILNDPDILSVSPFEDDAGDEWIDYDNDNNNDEWLQQIIFDSSDQTLSVFGDYGVSCYGSNNGFININTIGGTGIYYYEWTGDLDGDGDFNDFSDSEQNIYNLSSGDYQVVVTDQNYSINSGLSCSVTQIFTLEEPAEQVDVQIHVRHFTTANDSQMTLYEEGDVFDYGVSCNGAIDGEINIIASGGVGDYSYVLDLIDNNGNEQLINSGQLNDLPSGSLQALAAGNYILSIFDSNYNFFLQDITYFDELEYESCVFQIPITITEPYLVQIADPILSNYNGLMFLVMDLQMDRLILMHMVEKGKG